MKKKTSIFILSTILFFSVTTIFVLFQYSSQKQSHQYNSFLRKFPPTPIHISHTLDVKTNSYYIAGGDTNNLYFGNVLAPWHLLKTNLKLADTQHVVLNIKDQEELKFKSIRVTVDSPYFYFADGTIPAIFRGMTTDWIANLNMLQNSAYFLESVALNNTSFAIRTMSSLSNEITLGKISNDSPYVKLLPNLLEKQLDGKFCVEGVMHYSKHLAWLVYVYRYRNQFICADTSLNLIYRGNTIDTISQAKIKVAEIKSDNSFTMSAPPLKVNNMSSVSGNWLFINSNLLAKNEDKKSFEEASVIDVYNLKDGQYHASFYLPQHNKQKMREFRILDNTLIALHDRYILQYHIDPKYFNDRKTTKISEMKYNNF